MSNPFLDICTSGIASLQPYIPGKPVSELERELGIKESIKLASNENPLGPPACVAEVLQKELKDLALYPDGGGFALRDALAKRHGCDSLQVTLGNGSNDVLDMIARVFMAAGDEAIFSEYAFAVYPIVTQAVGATAKVAKAKDYGHDLDAMQALISVRTKVIFIANPNNPTGTWLNAKTLRTFVEAVPSNVIVVIDEAYTEYVADDDYPDASLWLNHFPNLIVTRTFSKAYGLAALRIGYSLSHPQVADLLNRVRQPFNVNSIAQAAALAALSDEEFIQRAVETNRQGMDQYETAFAQMGLEWIPSVGNFITVDLGRPAAEVNQKLLKLGVITRPVANYGMPNHLRISIGLPEQNSRCIAALEEALS